MLKKGFFAALILLSVPLALGAVDFRYWFAGTAQPDVAKFNGTWTNLENLNQAPSTTIYSGAFGRDYFYTGEGNDEQSKFNGTFTEAIGTSSSKVWALSANRTHLFSPTGNGEYYLYNESNDNWIYLGAPSGTPIIRSLDNSYNMRIEEDYFIFGTKSDQVYKWNESYTELSPGFFSSVIGTASHNATHFLFGDDAGNAGIYSSSGWVNLTTELGFGSAGKSVRAAEAGRFNNGRRFFLVGGSSGYIKKLYNNGTVIDLTGSLPGSWTVEKITYSWRENRFMVGGQNGNIYIYNSSGFYENSPSFTFQNTVNALEYNPYPHDSPRWRNLSQNQTNVSYGKSILLSAQARDEELLRYAKLSTNWTGAWQNVTGNYGSPKLLDTSSTWSWSNFTWQKNFETEKTVGWRIWYNDSNRKYNSTDIKTFKAVLPDVSRPEVTPEPVEASDTINVTVNVSEDSFNLKNVTLNLTDANGNLERSNRLMQKDLETGEYFYNTTLLNESSNFGEWDVNVTASYSEGVKSSNSTLLTVKMKKPPETRNQLQSDLDIASGEYNELSAEGFDNVLLESALLATNETGEWENKTGNYSSPISLDTSSVWSSTNFMWKNSSVNDSVVAWKIWYNDSLGQYRSTPVETFYVDGQDLNVTQLQFQRSDFTGEEEVNLTANISNFGSDSVENAEILFEVETYNGSWHTVKETNRKLNISAGSSKKPEFRWNAEPGRFRFNITADPQDNVSEIFETNNRDTVHRNVSSYHVFYGGSKGYIQLGKGSTNMTAWLGADMIQNVFFSDKDMVYSFGDLMPLNGSNDLSEADSKLNSTGHNDSIKELYDRNDDGEPDNTICTSIGGENLCEIPVINSTSTRSFKTGLLYDASNYVGFNGTQSIIVFTPTNKSETGKYGEYDFEIKVPATLGSQTGSTGKVDIQAEIR